MDTIIFPRDLAVRLQKDPDPRARAVLMVLSTRCRCLLERKTGRLLSKHHGAN